MIYTSNTSSISAIYISTRRCSHWNIAKRVGLLNLYGYWNTNLKKHRNVKMSTMKKVLGGFIV